MYTQSNNTLEVVSTTSSFKTSINPATTTSGTGRGVASFDGTQFSVVDGHVSIGSGGTAPVLTINGTADEVEVSRIDNEVTVGLPNDVTVTGQLNVGENVVVSGNLVVQGTTTTVDSETVTIADNIIVLNSNEEGTPSQDGGITIERGTSANKSFLWNETLDKWSIGSETLVASTFEGNLIGDVTGNADTATALETSRSIGISLSGDITGSGSASFDGTGNITINASTTYNNDVVLGTDTSGSYVQSLVPGALVDILNNSGESATPQIDVDLSELTDMTATMVGTDEFVVLDSSSQRRKAANEISLSVFNTTNSITLGTDTTGDYVASITAGSGIDVSGSGEGDTPTVSIESDLRGDVDQIGFSTSDYYQIDGTDHHWFIDGAEKLRLETDGDLHADGDLVAFSTTISDERQKKNISTVNNALEKISQLRGVEFDYIKNNERSAGLIAQDVQKVLPQAVREKSLLNSTDNEKSLVLEYAQINALLVEAIKELKAEIDDLKKNK